MLVSDTEYILEEAFSTLSSIASIEKMAEDSVSWNALPPAERKAKEEQLTRGVAQAKSQCRFASSLVEMVSFLTEVDLEPLLSDELRDKVLSLPSVSFGSSNSVGKKKVAGMLNFYLRLMVGKKYHDINVKNPARFQFEPRELVVRLVRILLKLGADEKFLGSCVKVCGLQVATFGDAHVLVLQIGHTVVCCGRVPARCGCDAAKRSRNGRRAKVVCRTD